MLSWKIIILTYALGTGIVLFNYNPQPDTDLGRYFTAISSINGLSLSEANNYFNDGLYFKNFLFWVTSKIGNYHILPAFATAFSYWTSGYIVGNTLEKNKKIELFPFILTFQYICLPLFSIGMNLRNIWAFSFVILAAYLDLFEKKRNIWILILYILPCFLHNSALTLILLRLLVPILKKHKYITIILFSFIPYFIDILYTLFSTGTDIVSKAIQSAYGYLNNELASDWAYDVTHNTYLLMQRFLMTFISILFVVLILMLSREKISKEMDNNSSSFIYYTFLIFLLEISSNIFQAPHFWRFYTAGIIGSGTTLSYFIMCYSKVGRFVQITIKFLYFMAIVIFVYNLYFIYISY